MIVKVVPGRRDGKTDMKQLAQYITQGMGDQVRQEAGFGQLTEYMAAEENVYGKQKCVAVALHGLGNLEDAAIELYAVAAKNTRVTDPVLHLVVSWPEFERPSNDEIFWAGRQLLKALNLHEHQSIMAIHGDTDNVHVHIEVNRVHPVTFRAQHLPWLHKTLHREARRIEIAKDWYHDTGLFVVQRSADGKKFVVPNTGHVETPDIVHGRLPAGDSGVAPDGAAGTEVQDVTRYRIDSPDAGGGRQHMDAWSDEPSLVTICREVVVDEVMAALDVDPTWDAVHHVLATHGMQLRQSGAGGWQLQAMKAADGEVIRLPASKALRKLQLGTLSDRLGTFIPASGPLRPPPSELPTVPGPRVEAADDPGPAKRDPEKRLLRRLERAEARTALIERYRAEKVMALANRARLREEGKQITAWRATQHAAARAEFASRRAEIQANPHLNDAVKRQQYSLLAMERLQQKLRIDAAAKERRDALTSSLPPVPQWRPWVESLAGAGDEAAISALRGLVYQERRDANKAARRLEGQDVVAGGAPQDIDGEIRQIIARRQREDAIHPPALLPQSEAQVLLRLIDGMQWRVTSNGSIRYSREQGDPLFTDRGNRVTFDRRHVSDEELRLTLMHAREKFGAAVVLSGSDKVFTERMVKAAAQLGIYVKNPELRGLWQQHAPAPQAANRERKPTGRPGRR